MTMHISIRADLNCDNFPDDDKVLQHLQTAIQKTIAEVLEFTDPDDAQGITCVVSRTGNPEKPARVR